MAIVAKREMARTRDLYALCCDILENETGDLVWTAEHRTRAAMLHRENGGLAVALIPHRGSATLDHYAAPGVAGDLLVRHGFGQGEVWSGREDI